MHEELDAIFGDSDRQCTFQDTLEMKYLERVIMETLRLFPPVPIIARYLNEDVKIGMRLNVLSYINNISSVISTYTYFRHSLIYKKTFTNL